MFIQLQNFLASECKFNEPFTEIFQILSVLDGNQYGPDVEYFRLWYESELPLFCRLVPWQICLNFAYNLCRKHCGVLSFKDATDLSRFLILEFNNWVKNPSSCLTLAPVNPRLASYTKLSFKVF